MRNLDGNPQRVFNTGPNRWESHFHPDVTPCATHSISLQSFPVAVTPFLWYSHSPPSPDPKRDSMRWGPWSLIGVTFVGTQRGAGDRMSKKAGPETHGIPLLKFALCKGNFPKKLLQIMLGLQIVNDHNLLRWDGTRSN